jgi:hypothetical protein
MLRLAKNINYIRRMFNPVMIYEKAASTISEASTRRRIDNVVRRTTLSMRIGIGNFIKIYRTL